MNRLELWNTVEGSRGAGEGAAWSGIGGWVGRCLGVLGVCHKGDEGRPGRNFGDVR